MSWDGFHTVLASRQEGGGRSMVDVSDGPRRGAPSQSCPGHEERMLAHSRRVRQVLRHTPEWGEHKEALFRLEQSGDIDGMMELLTQGHWTRPAPVAEQVDDDLADQEDRTG